MATWKSTPEQRAQAAQLVLRRVEYGATLADSIRHFAPVLEVSEDTLRRWVRQEKAGGHVAPDAEAPTAPVATAVLEPPVDTPRVVEPIDVLFEPSAVGGFPSVASAREQSGARKIAVIAAAVVAFFAGSFLVSKTFKIFQDSPHEKAAARISDYVAGKGTHEFVASDSNFRASFPFGAPRREADTQQVGPVAVDYVNYGTETDTGAFMVGSFALPAGVPYDLNAGVNGAAVALKAHVETATPTTFQGFPAIEFVMTGTESGRGYTDKGVFVDAGTRVYILQTIWESGVAPGYEAFKGSFHIG